MSSHTAIQTGLTGLDFFVSQATGLQRTVEGALSRKVDALTRSHTEAVNQLEGLRQITVGILGKFMLALGTVSSGVLDELQLAGWEDKVIAEVGASGMSYRGRSTTRVNYWTHNDPSGPEKNEERRVLIFNTLGVVAGSTYVDPFKPKIAPSVVFVIINGSVRCFKAVHCPESYEATTKGLSIDAGTFDFGEWKPEEALRAMLPPEALR